MSLHKLILTSHPCKPKKKALPFQAEPRSEERDDEIKKRAFIQSTQVSFADL